MRLLYSPGYLLPDMTGTAMFVNGERDSSSHIGAQRAEVRANKVRVEEGAQQLLALGEGAEDLGGGEGAVEEEATADAVEALAQQRGQHLQGGTLTVVFLSLGFV